MAQLYEAACTGNLEQLQQYIKEGQDVNFRNENGWTSLHVASDKGHVEVVKHLIENKADVNAVNNLQLTPLHKASISDHVRVAELLLANKADVDAISEAGFTPLMYAVNYGHLELTELLLTAGADCALHNDDGKTAVMLANDMGFSEMVNLIKSKGKIKEYINAVDKINTETISVDGEKCTLEERGVEYKIPEKNVTIFIPPPSEECSTDEVNDECSTDEVNDAVASEQITLTFEEPPKTMGECENVECYTEVIELQPHGKSFDDYLIIKLPKNKQPTGPENLRLLYNASEDPNNPKWVAVPNNPDTYEKSSYFVEEENSYSVYTRHLCQYSVGSADNLYEPTEIAAAFYGSYNEEESELTITTAFTCACHEHNYNKLTSWETLKDNGTLLQKPFTILVEKSDMRQLQPLRIEHSISNNGWECLLAEDELPCGPLGFKCNNDKLLHQVTSIFGTKTNVAAYLKINIEVTIKQLETNHRRIRVKPLELIPRKESATLSRQSSSATQSEMKRPCLCSFPTCVKRRGQGSENLLHKDRMGVFNCKYLMKEYDMFYRVLKSNTDKFYRLLKNYYNPKTEKNNLPRKETVFWYFKEEARKVKAWTPLWQHLKDLSWKEAVDTFEYVYERNRLLQMSDRLKRLIVFNHIKSDILKVGLIPKDGEKYIKDLSVKDVQKVEYVIKHVLLEDRPYEDIDVGLKELNFFNQILRGQYQGLLNRLTFSSSN